MHMTFDRKTPKSEITLRLALAKSKRNHGKRHATGGRAKRKSKAKKQRERHKLAVSKAARTKYLARVRAYWSGERDTL
jgi:hypothetical protein